MALDPPRRDLGLDALRGLLMVLVIIGHFPSSRFGLNPFGPLPEWIYFIHIPLFLALSCLFVKPFEGRKLLPRAQEILLPYAIWVVLSSPGRLFEHPLGLLGDLAFGNWAHLQSVLWFLPALFTTNLLVSLRRRARRSGPWIRVPATLGLLLAVGGALGFAHRVALQHARIPFGIDVAVFLLPFLWAMDQVWRRRGAWTLAAGRTLAPGALVLLGLGGVAIRTFEQVKTHSAFARRVDFAQFSVPETLAGYLGMVAMGAALLLLAGRLPCKEGLAVVGRRSMPIYLFHYPLLHAFSRTIGLAGEGRVLLLLYGVTVTVLVIGISLAAASILEARPGSTSR